jgi:hypothetical protein
VCAHGAARPSAGTAPRLPYWYGVAVTVDQSSRRDSLYITTFLPATGQTLPVTALAAGRAIRAAAIGPDYLWHGTYPARRERARPVARMNPHVLGWRRTYGASAGEELAELPCLSSASANQGRTATMHTSSSSA